MLSYTSLFLGFIIPAAETGSIRYKLTRIYTAFFVSGVIHMAGEAMVTGKIIFKAFTFFMSQPFGITIENLVAHLWRQWSPDNTSSVHVHDTVKKDTKSRGDGDKKSEEPIPPVWIRCEKGYRNRWAARLFFSQLPLGSARTVISLYLICE